MFYVHKGKCYTGDDVLKASATLTLPVVILSGTAEATNVRESLRPVINQLQDLAEPVAYAFMIYGGIKIISGQASEGKKMVKDAIGGYILIQWIPWIFNVIRSIR